MQTALITGEQVIVMLLLMAVGFMLYRLKLLNDTSCGQLNRVLMIVVVFSVLASSFDRDFDIEVLKNIGIGTLFAAAYYTVGTGVAFLAVRGNTERLRAERFAIVTSNCGFMGIPLISAVLGQEYVLYASCGILILNMYQWIVGPMILTGRIGRGTLRRVILNPGTLGCLAGLIIFVLPFRLPRPFMTAMSYVASLNTPLAMIIIGTFIARTDLRAHLRDRHTYLVCAFKLIVLPLLALPFYIIFRVDHAIAISSYIVMACPVAAAASLYPAMLGLKEGEVRGAGLSTISTVLSVITIPLMTLIFELLV